MEPCHYIFLFSEVLLKLMGGSIKNKNLYVCVFGNLGVGVTMKTHLKMGKSLCLSTT